MANNLEERLNALKGKQDNVGDQFSSDDIRTLVEGIEYAMSHGGTVGVTITALEDGSGYKITIIDSEGGAHEATLKNGGDAYEVYKSTVPSDQTPMSKDAWLASLKGADGADGQDGEPGHNPCLGRYNTLPAVADLPETPRAGDYIYVDDKTDPSNVVTTLYKYDATSPTGFDQGTIVDVNNVTFKGGKPVIDFGIDNEPTAGSENLVKSGGVYNFTGGTSIITFNSRATGHSSANDRINVRIPIGETFALQIDSQSTISGVAVYISSEENNTNHSIGSLEQGVVKKFTATETITSIGIYFIISSIDDVTLTLHKQTLDEKNRILHSDLQNNLIDNILHFQDIPDTVTQNGITFTNNGDGTITVNGTATDNAILNFGAEYKSPSALGIKLGTNYYMRGCPAGGGPATFKFNLDVRRASLGTAYNDFGQGCLVNMVSNEGTYNFRIVVYSGQTLDNLVFAPSLVEYKGVIKNHEERISEQENELAPIAFENDAYYNVHGNVGDTATLVKTSNNSYKTAKIACQKGDMFIINAIAGGDNAKTFTFVDNNNVILAPLFASTKFDGVLIAPDNAAYVIISSNNKALVSYSCKNLILDTRARVLKFENNNLDFYSIAPLGVKGVFNNSFRLEIPSDYAGIPMIASARAKFTTTGGKPTIRFISGHYSSIWYTIGDEEFTTKEWRIPPSITPNSSVLIRVDIPTGCTLTITNFSCRKDRTIDRKSVGVMLDAHLGFQSAAPENTMAAYELAAQCNYPACIVNPIFNAEDIPYCYHENDRYLSYQGGTTPVGLTAAEFAALTESDMNDYRVIGPINMQKTFNEKIPRLEDFFYLCSVTGMRPIFSTHPAPTEAQWLIIKGLLKKYRLLDKMLIKAFSVGILETAYSILGDVYGFIYDVNGADAVSYCDEMDNSTLANFEGPKGIEFRNANITETIAETVISRGYFCSVWEVGNITGERYKELIKWGVSEFVDDYNCSSGLNF